MDSMWHEKLSLCCIYAFMCLKRSQFRCFCMKIIRFWFQPIQPDRLHLKTHISVQVSAFFHQHYSLKSPWGITLKTTSFKKVSLHHQFYYTDGTIITLLVTSVGRKLFHSINQRCLIPQFENWTGIEKHDHISSALYLAWGEAEWFMLFRYNMNWDEVILFSTAYAKWEEEKWRHFISAEQTPQAISLCAGQRESTHTFVDATV